MHTSCEGLGRNIHDSKGAMHASNTCMTLIVMNMPHAVAARASRAAVYLTSGRRGGEVAAGPAAMRRGAGARLGPSVIGRSGAPRDFAEFPPMLRNALLAARP